MKLETWQKDLLTNPNTTGALELFRFMGYEPEYLITFAAVTLSVDLGENVQLQFRLTEPDEGGCRYAIREIVTKLEETEVNR